jgi:hypothetical protein
MPLLNNSVLLSHLRAIIKDLPVVCRWNGRLYTGTAGVTEAQESMAAGGILDLSKIGTVYFARPDFGNVYPQEADLFEIQDPVTNVWYERSIGKNSNLDPSGVGITFNLVSPDE